MVHDHRAICHKCPECIHKTLAPLRPLWDGLVVAPSVLKKHPEIDLVFAEGAYPFGAMATLAVSGTRPVIVITVKAAISLTALP